MGLGAQWATCLYCIPLFAVVPFAALILALRRGAPVNLKRTGAIAGLVAGALGAAVYAFHCSDDSLPFIAVWYGGMVVLCSWVGSQLGPLVLRLWFLCRILNRIFDYADSKFCFYLPL